MFQIGGTSRRRQAAHPQISAAAVTAGAGRTFLLIC